MSDIQRNGPAPLAQEIGHLQKMACLLQDLTTRLGERLRPLTREVPPETIREGRVLAAREVHAAPAPVVLTLQDVRGSLELVARRLEVLEQHLDV